MIFCKRQIKMGELFQSHNTKRTGNVEGSCQSKTSKFLWFCNIILEYEKYKLPQDEMHDSAYSPSGSDGTNDSFSNESNSSFQISESDMKNDNIGPDDDSWDCITCFCMKPFAGRPMIECSNCKNWLHMSCAKVRKNNIPENFSCPYCKDTKSGKRRSERIRSDDRGFPMLR